MINGDLTLKKKYNDYDEKNYTPNGLDLQLGQVYELNDNITQEYPYPVQYGLFKQPLPQYELKEKQLPEHHRIPSKFLDCTNIEGWSLLPNKVYILETDRQIQISPDSAQLYKPRSTLIRGGVYIYTATGDSGYNGYLSFMCINHSNQPFFLEKGVRFAQLIDFQVTDNSIVYDGDYQEPLEKEDKLTEEANWTQNRIQF